MAQIIERTRLLNARALVKTAGGVAAFARALEMSSSYASQIVGQRPRRNIGSELARRIERAFDRPEGWLDAETHQLEQVERSALSPAEFEVLYAQIVQIPVMKKDGAGSTSREPIMGSLTLNKEWMSENLRGISSANNLAVITGEGDSMEPTIRDGDILLVDRGINEIVADAIYLAEFRREIHLKRFQRGKNGEIFVLSDNRFNQPITIEPHERPDLRVLGRVVFAWAGRRL